MESPFLEILQEMGQNYSIERDGNLINTVQGLKNTEKSSGKKYIGFIPGTDIKPDDWVINDSSERFLIIDVETDSFEGKPNQKKCYCLSERESKMQKSAAPIFNINAAYNSVIGTGNTINVNYYELIHHIKEDIENSNSQDKEELRKIVSLLEMVVNNQVPPSKGLFSKFSAALERNSWITGAIASTIFSWMTSKIG